MNNVLNLIKKKYCEDFFIRDSKSISLEHVSVNRKGNNVFLVTSPTGNSYYELKKVNLSGLSNNKSLSIPKQYRNDFDVNHSKSMIANWINRHTGLRLIEEDIAYLVPEKDHLCVVIAADSMRFEQASIMLARL